MTNLSNDQITELLHHGYRYALSLVQHSSAAEDLLQTAWLSILKAKGEFSRPYLFTTLRNHFINQYKRDSLIPMMSLETYEHLELEESCDEPIVSYDTREVEQALALLRPIEREVVYLAYVEEYTAAEISDHTDLPRGTVLSLMHRARGKLRDHLKSNSEEMLK